MQEVSAILLAAGRSQRMGKEKLLLTLNNEPIIARCVQTLRKGGIGDIVVVTRTEGAAIRAQCDPSRVRHIINPDPQSDMAGSVRAGLEATRCKTVLVFPADFPLISPATIKEMVSGTGSGIVIPRFHGKPGHPVLFSRTVLDEIKMETTLRTVISQHQDEVRYVDVLDQGILLDMDSPEDYRRICEIFQNERHP